MEAELCGDSLGHKRSDPEGVACGGDAKRPREDGNGLHSSSIEMETEVEDDDYEEENPLDIYRQVWIDDYSRFGISFEDETEIPNMHHTDGPIIPSGARPMTTMQILYVKVTQITDALQWPLDIYGVIAVRDSIDHKRNFLFRRTRDQCQTLASLQDADLELALAVRFC
ncbi:uncharacterized protein LOC104584774 [Brachypodium distachyon]|uniref:DUF6598 domain-containing protein n=1 Tax=Brachypodium distachyon TaxID=15368 RepID=A0A0Q3LHF8_BRADI|nr:uncharacterized protein LOC104584774 [Brachypodium distachyon]KQJ92061.1 hypothetical protein BRADI_4g41496v3 [Brachypodium distachyon]KQJ92062.1 hypothetical protein BRADI_4g41496v3 [Brachypodium distachyon]|eukprot:XP_010238673.1 uncharacterized protein LOC104584774 [Brachypodium distachyon]